jgi:hypothetical protein
MIGQQINALRTDFAGQFAALGQRLDRLVTTDTHQADIRRLDDATHAERRRIDGQLQAIVGDLGVVRQERVEREAALASSVADLRKALQSESDNRRASEAARDKQRRDDMRWWFGSLVGLAAVVIAAIGLFQ